MCHVYMYKYIVYFNLFCVRNVQCVTNCQVNFFSLIMLFFNSKYKFFGAKHVIVINLWWMGHSSQLSSSCCYHGNLETFPGMKRSCRGSKVVMLSCSLAIYIITCFYFILKFACRITD